MTRASSFLHGVNSIGGLHAKFVSRVHGVPLTVDKWETLNQLEPHHRKVVEEMGFEWEQLWRAEQVHGDEVAVVPLDSEVPDRIVPKVDGLLTGEPNILLGIYVADCGAVFLADRNTGAIGLVHSGKKGSEMEIVVRAIERMEAEFGTRREDLEVAISPCIRPPHYEIDFAADIVRQLAEAGIPAEQVTDSGICTASEVGEYYSYRIERGETGRMLALLGRRADDAGAP